MKNKLLKLGVPLAAALLLAACGGGGGSGGYFPIVNAPPAQNPPPQTTQPETMADAYDGFIAYVKQMVTNVSETDLPADVSKFDPPPTSETKDPVSTQ